jgi:hypothetical protein
MRQWLCMHKCGSALLLQLLKDTISSEQKVTVVA